jgi:DeoR family glycerol-3-phosphate regulon repressor
LLVVTNNLNVATILAGNSECEVVLTGGRLRAADGGLVGTLAVDTVRQFKFDVAVIGCSALDLDGDLLDFDLDEVRVAQVILSQSRTAVAVADHSKLQRTAPARIASLAELQTLVTDATLPQPLMQRCADWGVNVLQTKKESL